MDESYVKKCSTCKLEKPLQHFQYARDKRRWKSRCSACKQKKEIERRERLGPKPPVKRKAYMRRTLLKRDNPWCDPEVIDMVFELAGTIDGDPDDYQ